jgi:hypothetical protein
MQNYNRDNYLNGLQNLTDELDTDNDLIIEMLKSDFIKDMAQCNDKIAFSSALTIVNEGKKVPLDLKEIMNNINNAKYPKGGRRRSNKKSRNLRKRRQSRQRY